MTLEDFLPPGTLKRSISLNLYPEEIDRLDAMCRQYHCGRPEIISALLKAHGDTDLSDVKPGRRPGGGRKPSGKG